MSGPELKPTLWRSCRVLASRSRLEILKLLLQSPPMIIKDVAAHMQITPELATHDLRALQSRGLLRAKRVSRYVFYTPAAEPSVPTALPLLRTLSTMLVDPTVSISDLIATFTACTHPRRLLIIQQLLTGPRTGPQLHAATGISWQALGRHLDKLLRRRFLTKVHRVYVLTVPDDPLSRLLVQLAES